MKILAKLSFYLFASTLIIPILFTACSTAKEVTSSWSSEKIIIDGNLSDWQGTLQRESDKNFSYGIKNDDKFIYLCYTTDNRMNMMQILRGGMFIWIKPFDSGDELFGIKYPFSKQLFDPSEFRGMNRDQMNPEALEKMFNDMLKKQNELEIVNNKKFPLAAMPIESKFGIKARLGYQNQNFVYELQIPLMVTDDFEFAIGTLPGENLNIRFETEGLKMETPGTGARQGGGSGMMGGGMRQGGSMGGRFQMPDPLDYTIKVVLDKK